MSGVDRNRPGSNALIPLFLAIQTWHRVCMYARHIRVLDFDETREPEACAHLLEVMDAIGGGLKVFPRLTTVWWDAVTPIGLRAAARVLGPSVRDLSLTLEDGHEGLDEEVERVCEAVVDAGSRLRHFSLGGTANLSRSTSSRLLSLIEMNTDLVSLHVDETLARNESLTSILPTLSRLESLHCTLRELFPRCHTLSLHPPPPPHTSLHTLILDGNTSALTLFARLLPRMTKAEVVVNLFECPRGPEREELLKVLKDLCGDEGRVEISELCEKGDEDEDTEDEEAVEREEDEMDSHQRANNGVEGGISPGDDEVVLELLLEQTAQSVSPTALLEFLKSMQDSKPFVLDPVAVWATHPECGDLAFCSRTCMDIEVVG